MHPPACDILALHRFPLYHLLFSGAFRACHPLQGHDKIPSPAAQAKAVAGQSQLLVAANQCANQHERCRGRHGSGLALCILLLFSEEGDQHLLAA